MGFYGKITIGLDNVCLITVDIMTCIKFNAKLNIKKVGLAFTEQPQRDTPN